MMGKKDKSKKKAKKEAEDKASEDQEQDSEAQTTEEAQPEETPLEKAERERNELRALWQRSQADYQNLKRRQLSDIDAAVRGARGNLLSELLVVLDYLDMALITPVENPEAKNLRVGVEMTRQQFWSSLEQQGVSVIATEGSFDPELHQAVSTVETEEHEAGTVLEVVRKGYRMPDMVLRHAQVKVATAPSSEEVPQPEEPEPEAAGDSDPEAATAEQ